MPIFRLHAEPDPDADRYADADSDLQPTPTPTPTPTRLQAVADRNSRPRPRRLSRRPAVLGISPGMLAILELCGDGSRLSRPGPRSGSLNRSFTLPIELSGVSMSDQWRGCGLKVVEQARIEFVVPRGLLSAVCREHLPDRILIITESR